jgi:hypothetical protein
MLTLTHKHTLKKLSPNIEHHSIDLINRHADTRLVSKVLSVSPPPADKHNEISSRFSDIPLRRESLCVCECVYKLRRILVTQSSNNNFFLLVCHLEGRRSFCGW